MYLNHSDYKCVKYTR